MRGIDVSKVRVSRNAHLILPYHIALDAALEARLGWRGGRHHPPRDRAGLRGSGPAGRPAGGGPGRRGARSGPASARVLPDKNALLARLPGDAQFELEPLVSQAMAWGERLRPHLADTVWLVQDALARGDHVLLEGAQGTLLDLDHGSYPYVTCSNPIAGGACTGGGIGPLQVDEVIGVMKAYSTRVGSGPYPTELTDEIGAGIAAARPRGRHDDRPAAAGGLVRCRPPALRGGGQQRQLDHAQQARHPVRPRRDLPVRRLRDRRPAGRGVAVERRAAGRASPIYERFPGLVASRSTRRGRWPTCPRTPGAT